MRALNFYACLLCLFIPALEIAAQSFVTVNAGIVGVGRSSVAWADYDLDNDLDLLVTGNTGSGPYAAAVYRNDAGVFNNINAGLTGIDNSSVAWGDFDADGDPDILASGRSSGSTKTFLYRNDNGVFTPVEAGFPNVGSYGCVSWGDYDGDSDLDALISGNYATRLFQNDGGLFSEVAVELPAVSNCWVNMGDYDNDGDQDIFVMGDVGGWPVAVLCENEDGFFFAHDTSGIVPLSGGSASWYDYDRDQDLDVLVCGFDQYLEPKTYIFRNDGDYQFTNVWPGIAGAALGTAAWGDYDNDGDADVLITGQNAACGSLSSLVYRNDGNNNFNDINAPLDGAERGSAAWGDYDNDGDLDIIISGFNGSGLPATRLYRNTAGTNSSSSNQVPEPVTGLLSSVNGNTVQLSWSNSSDNTTPEEGISYNLRVGTNPGGQDVLSAMADATGFHRVPQPGNVGNDTAWQLALPDGTYYWSVQALDHGFAASAFATEQQFTITQVGLPQFNSEPVVQFSPNPFGDPLHINCSTETAIEVFNTSGICIHRAEQARSHELNTSHWPSGVYYFRLSGRSSTQTRVLVK